MRDCEPTRQISCSAIPTQALPQPSRTIVLQGGRSRLKRAAHVQGICSNLSDRRRCSQRRSRQCSVHPPPTPCRTGFVRFAHTEFGLEKSLERNALHRRTEMDSLPVGPLVYNGTFSFILRIEPLFRFQ